MTYELGTGNSIPKIPITKNDYPEFPKATLVTNGLIQRRLFVPGTDSKIIARAAIYIMSGDSTGYRAAIIEDFDEYKKLLYLGLPKKDKESFSPLSILESLSIEIWSFPSTTPSTISATW